jgi:phage gpG-like protein
LYKTQEDKAVAGANEGFAAITPEGGIAAHPKEWSTAERLDGDQEVRC